MFFSTRTSLFPDSLAVMTSRAWSITSASFVPTRQSLAKKKLKDGAEAKIRLIESMNPHWYDLAESWTDVPVATDSTSLLLPRSLTRLKRAEFQDDAFVEDVSACSAVKGFLLSRRATISKFFPCRTS